jgi:hypothetical protein
MTFNITYGTLNEICAIRRVRNPGSNFIKANSNISETPVIISGFKIGRYVKFIMTAFSLFRIEYMPIAAAVPMIAARTDDISASIIVFLKAVIINSFRNSLSYHSSVNPAHTDLLLDALNENTISINIGAYKNKKTSPI